jgi:hypothetical protein
MGYPQRASMMAPPLGRTVPTMPHTRAVSLTLNRRRARAPARPTQTFALVRAVNYEQTLGRRLTYP